MSKVQKALDRGQRRMDKLTERYSARMGQEFGKVNGVLAEMSNFCAKMGSGPIVDVTIEQWEKLSLLDEASQRAYHLPREHPCMAPSCWKPRP